MLNRIRFATRDKTGLELHFAVLLFGFAGLFGKLISASPVFIVFGRALFAALAIFLVLKLFYAGPKNTSVKSLAIIGGSGIILAIHWLAFFYAIQLSTVAIGLVGVATFPIFVTFLEPLLSSKRIRGVDILSAFVVLIGLVLVAPDFDLSNSSTAGLLWAILSGSLFAVLTLLNRGLVVEHSALDVTFYQQLVAGLVLLPLVVLNWETPSSNTVILLFVLGVVCTAVPHALFIKSLTQLKAQLASIVTCLEPVYGILFAALLLNEIPDVKTLVGAGFVLTAVILATKAHRDSGGVV